MRDLIFDEPLFVALLPVKAPGTGKSRLVDLRDEDRTALAAAFATDVVTACRSTSAVAEIVMITDDLGFAASLPGVVPCTDPGGGLNAALRYGAAQARRTHPRLRPVALCADLPSLTGADLLCAFDLIASHAHPCFLTDADGTGTTLYSATYEEFDPQYGPGSAQAHHASGAVGLPGALLTARHDVDDMADLSAAIELGVGAATRAVLASLALPR